MIALFDTSAFVKLVVPEPGAAFGHGVWVGADQGDHPAGCLL